MLGLKYKTQHAWSSHAAPEPEIVEMPARKMAVVHTTGAPDRVMHLVVPALYSSVYKLNCILRKQGEGFQLEHLRARWPDADQLPVYMRHGIWGLPIPEEITTLPQRFPYIAVEIETWQYGTVAQLLHLCGHAEDGPDVERLRDFIEAGGFEITGAFEEEFVSGLSGSGSGLGAVPQKRIIRYPVRKSVKYTPDRAPGLVSEHTLLVSTR